MNPDRCAPSDPTPTVHKLMLDTNVVDELLDDSHLVKYIIAAVESGNVQLFVTHVQADEIGRMTGEKATKREALLGVLTEVPASSVPTAGIVIGHSRFDQTMFGSDHNAELFHVLKGGNSKHIEDAQIVLTAAWLYADIVSNDKRVVNTLAPEVGINAYRTSELREFLCQWCPRDDGPSF